jgi:large subunit ribosomal protein L24
MARTTQRIRIKKGDTVFVRTGKEKGKTGKVLDIDHDKQRAIVEKLMVVKRHLKRGRNPGSPEGGIVEKNGSIHISNLALLDPESKKATRIGSKVLENGKRVRVAKRSGAQIDQ